MVGLFYILLFYLLGMGISRLTGGIIPSSVIGMVLLFLALVLKVIRPGDVRQAARFILNNMVLFFIPVSVGLIDAWGLIAGNFWPFLTACIVSTVLVIGAVGLTQQGMDRSLRYRAHKRERRGR
ncbi:MAG: CidA/LrgA family protein [Rikenellaceae bacterium]|jgi:holin-like protein|nr:CidA/LrgA family protein [Rikenellaceae bacterium]